MSGITLISYVVDYPEGTGDMKADRIELSNSIFKRSLNSFSIELLSELGGFSLCMLFKEAKRCFAEAPSLHLARTEIPEVEIPLGVNVCGQQFVDQLRVVELSKSLADHLDHRDFRAPARFPGRVPDFLGLRYPRNGIA